MRERPLIMYPHEVRAVRDGRQTQFRRVIKPQPERHGYGNDYLLMQLAKTCPVAPVYSEKDIREWLWKYCPYGVPGDRLWVKETWAPHLKDRDKQCLPTDNIKYRADGDYFSTEWRPSVHMPRWASRLLLEVVSVRVERLQEISEEDAYKEGVCPSKINMLQIFNLAPVKMPKKHFIETWDSINGKAHPWEKNDWVWATEFKRID